MLDTAVRPMSRVPPGSRWLKKKKKRTAGQGGGRRQSASFYVERLGATWDDFTYKSSSLTGGVSMMNLSWNVVILLACPQSLGIFPFHLENVDGLCTLCVWPAPFIRPIFLTCVCINFLLFAACVRVVIRPKMTLLIDVEKRQPCATSKC